MLTPYQRKVLLVLIAFGPLAPACRAADTLPKKEPSEVVFKAADRATLIFQIDMAQNQYAISAVVEETELELVKASLRVEAGTLETGKFKNNPGLIVPVDFTHHRKKKGKISFIANARVSPETKVQADHLQVSFDTTKVNVVHKYRIVVPDVTSAEAASVFHLVRITNGTQLVWNNAKLSGFGFPKDTDSSQSLTGSPELTSDGMADLVFEETVPAEQEIVADLTSIAVPGSSKQSKPTNPTRAAKLLEWPTKFEAFADVTWQAADDPEVSLTQSVADKKGREAFLKAAHTIGKVKTVEIARVPLGRVGILFVDQKLEFKEHHQWTLCLVNSSTPHDVRCKLGDDWSNASEDGTEIPALPGPLQVQGPSFVYASKAMKHYLFLAGIVPFYRTPEDKVDSSSATQIEGLRKFLDEVLQDRDQIGRGDIERQTQQAILSNYCAELQFVEMAATNYRELFKQTQENIERLNKQLRQPNLPPETRSAINVELGQLHGLREKEASRFLAAAHAYNDTVRASKTANMNHP